MRLYTHNHDAAYSFLLDAGPLDANGKPTRSSGMRRLEYFFGKADPRYVFFELDIFWAYVARFKHQTYIDRRGDAAHRPVRPDPHRGRRARPVPAVPRQGRQPEHRRAQRLRHGAARRGRHQLPAVLPDHRRAPTSTTPTGSRTPRPAAPRTPASRWTFARPQLHEHVRADHLHVATDPAHPIRLPERARGDARPASGLASPDDDAITLRRRWHADRGDHGSRPRHGSGSARADRRPAADLDRRSRERPGRPAVRRPGARRTTRCWSSPRPPASADRPSQDGVHDHPGTGPGQRFHRHRHPGRRPRSPPRTWPTSAPSCSSTPPATCSTRPRRARSRATSRPAAATSACTRRPRPSRTGRSTRIWSAPRWPAPPASSRGNVDVADRAHPSTETVPRTLTLTEEWYNFTANVRGQSHVLATVDEKPSPAAQWASTTRSPGARTTRAAARGTPGSATRSSPTATTTSRSTCSAASSGRPAWSRATAARPCSATTRRSRSTTSPASRCRWPCCPTAGCCTTPAAARSGSTTRTTGASPVITTIPVYSHDEDGLQTLAIDPDFATNKWVYVYYAPRLNTPVDNPATPGVNEGDAPATSTDPTVVGQVQGLQPAVPVQVGGGADPAPGHGHRAADHPGRRRPRHLLPRRRQGEVRRQGPLYLITGDDTNAGGSDGFTPINDVADAGPGLRRPALRGQHQRPARQAAADQGEGRTGRTPSRPATCSPRRRTTTTRPVRRSS